MICRPSHNKLHRQMFWFHFPLILARIFIFNSSSSALFSACASNSIFFCLIFVELQLWRLFTYKIVELYCGSRFNFNHFVQPKMKRAAIDRSSHTAHNSNNSSTNITPAQYDERCSHRNRILKEKGWQECNSINMSNYKWIDVGRKKVPFWLVRETENKERKKKKVSWSWHPKHMNTSTPPQMHSQFHCSRIEDSTAQLIARKEFAFSIESSTVHRKKVHTHTHQPRSMLLCASIWCRYQSNNLRTII